MPGMTIKQLNHTLAQSKKILIERDILVLSERGIPGSCKMLGLELLFTSFFYDVVTNKVRVGTTPLGKGPKIEKRESMVFDHRGGVGGHPQPNPYSDLGKHV